MSDEADRLAAKIDSKEALLEVEKNSQRVTEIKNEIQGLQIAVQTEIAQQTGNEPPA